jgi:ABC-type uncharacterized transport system ATPase subunit
VASVYGMSWFRRRPKIKRALEFVDLWDARNKLASELSGGMQRRLELAATLVHNPELIFVDEPTAGIDPVLRSKFWDHFRELRDQGRTIFVTTQYVTEADYCDTVAILNRGRILAIGEPEQIRRDAFGGDVVNLSLEFVSPESIEILRHVPGVTYIQFLNTQDLKLTVDEGAETVPLIIAALQDAGIGVKTIEQYRPDFEEVFVRLMEQDRPENDEELDSVYQESPAAPDGAAPASVGSAPAPVAAQPESRPQPPPRSEEFIRPQVAVQPEMPLSRREIRPATPQPKNLPFRREQPAPPHPLPGPTPANPNPAGRRPVITSYTYQPKNPPGPPGPDPLQDPQKLPPVPPTRSAADQTPDNRGTSNYNV